MRTRWLLAVVVALLACGLGAGALRAQPAPDKIEEAKRLFRAGDRAYREGQFDFAAQAFDEAYALAPRPALRFSAAQALRKLYSVERDVAALRKAKAYLEQYLREVPDGGRRLDAAEALEEIERILRSDAPDAGEGGAGDDGQTAAPTAAPANGKMQIDATVVGAVATVDGHVTREPLPVFLKLAPGTYRVTVDAPGYLPDVRTVSVSAGDLAIVNARLDEKPAQMFITGDEDADVVIDGRLMGRTPMGRPLELPSGRHSIAIGIRGYDPLVESVTLGRGQRLDLDVDLSLSTQRIFAWSFFGAGAAFLGAGVIMSALSLSHQSDAQKIVDRTTAVGKAMRRTDAEEYNGLVETRDNLNRIAGTAYTLGLISGGVGLLLFILDDPDLYALSAEEMKLDAGLTPQPGGGAVFIRGAF